MAAPQAPILADQLERARGWTLSLTADLEGDQWTFQPAPGLHHPLWIMGHLASAENGLVLVRCAGEDALDDAFRSHFKTGGPVPSAAEHAFPPPREVLDAAARVHARALEYIRSADAADLQAPPAGPAHPAFTDKLGALKLASVHESFHAGQIALLRRLQGKNFLR